MIILYVLQSCYLVVFLMVAGVSYNPGINSASHGSEISSSSSAGLRWSSEAKTTHLLLRESPTRFRVNIKQEQIAQRSWTSV
jgi:hypothetical protein